MYRAGLILEGGGMRGIYTTGVLDFFLEKEMEFSSCYGVSAGACTLCSFLSKQKGRAYHTTVDYLGDKHYCSAYSLLTTGDMFGVKMCYDDIPNKLNPYDFEMFNSYKGKAYVVVTNMKTGKAEYYRLKDMKKDILAVRASSSLPLVSRNVQMGEQFYLDGGLSDSIPIQKSILGGNRKNVVILTKEEGYRRKASANLAAVKLRYVKYPKIYDLMKNRHIQYNETLDYLENQVKNGQAFVIRPKEDIGIGRIEKDPVKLRRLYKSGYRDALACYNQLQQYLIV